MDILDQPTDKGRKKIYNPNPMKSSYTFFIQVLYNIIQNMYRICSDT